MGNSELRRPPLPARLTSAERDFYLELRRLLAAAGLSCRALEDGTSSSRSESGEPSFFSKSQWSRWLNGESSPPRKAVRKLAELLAKEEIAADHLVDVWDDAFASADSPAKRDGDAPDEQLRPRQLPIPAQQFVGRTRQLKSLTGLAEDVASGRGPIVVVIDGTAGVGKTTLANYLAHGVSDKFPDGQLYTNMRGFDHAAEPMSSAEVLPGFLHALGLPPESFPVSADDQAGLYRSVLADKRVLIVIDNAHDAEQVRPLLPGSPGSLVLVTSRNRIPGLVAEGARPLKLDPFTSDDAHELLNSRLGRDRADKESQAVSELIALCAGLPLALSVAAAHAAMHPEFPLAALTHEFRSRGLDLLDTGDPATTTRTVLSRSYDHLSDRAARVFRLLGLLPGPDISLPAVASLTARPINEARKALDELTWAHLVEEHRPGRFSFHELLRTYAAEQAERHDSEDERRTAAHRVLDHYLHSGMSATARFTIRSPLSIAQPQPGVVLVDVADESQAADWFDAEAQPLLALVAYADARGFDEHAWLIPWMLSVYLNRRGRHRDWVATELVAVAAARRLRDPRAQAHSHYHLGWALSSVGDNERAEPNVQRSLELFGELGDRGLEAMALNGLACMRADQGRHSEALAVGLDGLRKARAAKYWWLQGTLENTVGEIYAHLEQYDLGMSHCQRALSLNREVGSRIGTAESMRVIGHIHAQRGERTRARASYEQAVEVFRESGYLVHESQALTELGDILAADGDASGARRVWLEAEAILDRLSHPKAEEVRAKLNGLNGLGG
ncbi:MAG TPA: tetratricopeptide repeat protein [Streptosporangiaceae bacterium]